MVKNGKARLIQAAAKARRNACALYSNFQVGAAVLTSTGQIFTGVNIESASFGLTCCAERVALFNALSAGRRVFAAVAIVADVEGGLMPCGACRQLLAEYAPRAFVWTASSRALRKAREFAVGDLLPRAFLAFAAGQKSTAKDPSSGG